MLKLAGLTLQCILSRFLTTVDILFTLVLNYLDGCLNRLRQLTMPYHNHLSC